MPDNRRLKGRIAEDAAELYLRSRGYRILERNWRCRAGEIDLVAEREGVTTFVEVRSRGASLPLGSPEESVNARKQYRVRRAAAMYLQGGEAERPVAFDVVAVRLDSRLQVASLHHIRNAF